MPRPLYFFPVEPCQEFVWFNSMFDVVKCTVAVDLASKLKLIFLHFPLVSQSQLKNFVNAVSVMGNLSFLICNVLFPLRVVTVSPGSRSVIVMRSILIFGIRLYVDFCMGLVPAMSAVIKILMG